MDHPNNMALQPGTVKEVPKRAFLAFTLSQMEFLMPARELYDQGLRWEQHVTNQALTQRWAADRACSQQCEALSHRQRLDSPWKAKESYAIW